ncbi:gamma-secretase subunit aph-1-like protein 2 [Sarcoptes scabiei]|uniref:Gamma-secretase subunit aph-1-like protein 2 n=1 Tax=Sarcoptes scabiei TaxID=52283 RepID=A0A131ZUX8_SARSC|nr:gamma-secretase subunit aph-1-like protein 2 [Sarcoptes scabiei]
MTFIEFIGCSMIAFGPSLAIFCSVIAKDPIRIIILISAKAEIGLQKVAEVGNNIAEPRPKFYNNRAQLSFGDSSKFFF